MYKVFGRKPRDAVQQLEGGATRADLAASGTTAAVIDASFQVAEGETFVVMGLSGSGKSTLIRMLNGLLPATEGHVYIDGEDISAMSAKQIREIRQRRMSMVFQHFALFPHRTVLDNAAYGLEMQGIEREQRRSKAMDSLQKVGLEGWENHLPDQLSGGMRQRVGLARALAADTDVLLMDEAFSALDPLIRRDMQDQLLQLQAELGKTIIFITHDLNEAMRIGDHIAVMREGRIVQIGTAEDILNDPANDYVAQFVQDVDRAKVLTATAVMEKPMSTIGSNSGPRAALRVMREGQHTALFVVDRQGTLVGVVEDDAVAAAADRGEETVAAAISTDFPEVTPDTPVFQLFIPSAQTRVPLAVVDGHRKLLGIVPRATLLAALGKQPTVTGSDEEESESTGMQEVTTADA